jgi:hypothetical protein
MVGGIGMLCFLVLFILNAVDRFTRGRDADGRRTRGVVTRWALDALGIEHRRSVPQSDNSWSDYLGR